MEAGKGSRPRPVDKKKYDANYLRIFGTECKHCEGKGWRWCKGYQVKCLFCDGIGYSDFVKWKEAKKELGL